MRCALSTPNLSVRIETADFVVEATWRVLKRLGEGPYEMNLHGLDSTGQDI